MSKEKKINCRVSTISPVIIILNSLIVKINGILNANLELSMLINIVLVVRAYSYRTSKELG